ncbi:hypothetical protein BC941DRAFT_431595 [Chlamydoabsidia padenii]|nr:hypothetical protein BC941DRAFT_431595 [Chlamydoabsidia padenii]
MDLWNDMCTKAFNGDEQSNDFIQLIQRSGRLNKENNNFMVTLDKEYQQHDILLLSLGFTHDPSHQHTYLLSGEEWVAFNQAKRQRRMEWHGTLQQTLKQELEACIDRVQVPLDLTTGQRLVLVQEFSRNHRKNVGSVPFLRGLVGCLRAQLYKRQLVDWQVAEYVLTQNGQDAMMDYIRLIRGILGMTLVFKKDGSHDQATNGMVAVDMMPRETTVPVVATATAVDDDDHYMIWRMNPDLSDHELTDLLECLPRQQCNQCFPLSPVSRSNSTLLPSSFILRWISLLFKRCLSILPF